MNALHEWLAAPWVETLGRTLLHFIWQGAVLGALAWVVLRLTHKRSANVRYVLAGLLMLVLAIAPMVTFLVLSKTAPVPAMPVPVVTAISGLRDNPPMETEPSAGPALLPVQNLAMPKLVTVAAPMVLVRTTKLAAWWMVPFWLAGVFIMAVRLGLGWLRIQRWQRSATAALDAALLASFQCLTKKFGLGAKVRLLISKKIAGPVTFGWVKPAVLLPAQLVTGLPPELLEALLAHELAHIARQDYLANLVQSTIEVVLFYHPAVWWLGARLREIREECCDEMAVQACGDRLTYARALASLAERQWSAEPAAAASGGNLLARISRIVGRAPETSGSASAGTLLLLVAAVGFIACLSASSTKAQDQTAPLSQNKKSASTPALTSNANELPDTLEIEARFYDYPSDIRFQLPNDPIKVNEYLDGFEHRKEIRVQSAPNIAILAGKEATINIRQSKAKKNGLHYSGVPFDLTLALQWHWNGNQIEYSGTESLTPTAQAGSPGTNNAQNSEPTELRLFGKTALNQPNVYGFGVESGHQQITVIVFKEKNSTSDGSPKPPQNPTTSLSPPVTNLVLFHGNLTMPPEGTVPLNSFGILGGNLCTDPGSSPTLSNTLVNFGTSVFKFNGETLTIDSPTQQWNGNFTYHGTSNLNLGTGIVNRVPSMPPVGITSGNLYLNYSKLQAEPAEVLGDDNLNGYKNASTLDWTTFSNSTLPAVSPDTLVDVDVASSSTYNPTRPVGPGTLVLNGVTYRDVAVKNTTSTATIDAGSTGRLAIGNTGPGQVSVTQGLENLAFGGASNGITKQVEVHAIYNTDISVPRQVSDDTLFGPKLSQNTQPWKPSPGYQLNWYPNNALNLGTGSGSPGTLMLSGVNNTTVNGSSTDSSIPKPDPTIREDVTIQVPTQLKVQRAQWGLVVTADQQSSAPAQISVGKNMTLVVLTARRIHHNGEPYSEHLQEVHLGALVQGFPLGRICNLIQWANPVTVDDWSDDKTYDVDFEYCLVEAPHWVSWPTVGIDDTLKNTKEIRVLWRKTVSITFNEKSVGPEITYGIIPPLPTFAPKAPDATATASPPKTSAISPAPTPALPDYKLKLLEDMENQSNHYLMILGEVAHEKMYSRNQSFIALKPPSTLSEAISQAGWTIWSDHTVQLMRKNEDGQRVIQEYDVDEVLVNGHKDKDVTLQPGDIVIVPALASKPVAPAPPIGGFSNIEKPTATNVKTELRRNVALAPAGEYVSTASNGKQVPVTLEKARVYAEAD